MGNIYHSDVVRVTKEDIENGEPENIKCCAVALAVERTFTKHYKNLEQQVAENGYISFRDKDTKKHIYHLEISDIDTSEISRFVEEFDGGYYVEPFEFNATMREGSL
tara:strand:+ start:1182 stop:1502 length:321 start_codon:yes stop_codon:yes gene_type:complete